MSMYTIMVEAHSGWRHLIVAVIAVAILRAVYGWIRNSEWGVWDNRIGLATPIVMDIQLLLGIVVWIMSKQWLGYNTLAAWEHPVVMILAVAAAHITWVQIKRRVASQDKFRIATIGFAITAVILAFGIARITHFI